MLLRFSMYMVIGVVCGVIGWFSPYWTRWIPLPFEVSQLVYLAAIWLLPALFVSLHEARSSRLPRSAALATLTLWLYATQTYYLSYALLVAIGQAGPGLEMLQLIGGSTSNSTYFWSFIQLTIVPHMLKWGTIAILTGSSFGGIMGWMYLYILQRQQLGNRSAQLS